MRSLIKLNVGKKLDSRIKLSRTGLVLPKGMELAQWQEAGKQLSEMNGGVHWWIGDWLNYGSLAYGEKYEEALEKTEFDYGTLRNDKYVSERIELSRRRDNLSWSHHQEVAPLEPKEQDEFLEQAEKQGWTRRELRQNMATARRSHKQVEWPKGKYRMIEADPPWQYGDERTLTVAAGAAAAHYPTMDTDAICALKVAELALPDAVLFLWVTAPLLPDGLRVVEAWGFTYKACFVWDKVRGYNGHYNDVQHELLLVATRGSCVPDVATLPKSILREEKTKHSRKPECFVKMEETLYPDGPRLELFQRVKRTGWDGWGNESV